MSSNGSDQEDAPGPARRSGRERKQVQLFAAESSKNAKKSRKSAADARARGKGKKSAEAEDDDAPSDSEPERDDEDSGAEDDSEEEDSEDDFEAPKRSQRRASGARAKAKGPGGGAAKAPSARKPRKKAAKKADHGGDDDDDAEGGAAPAFGKGDAVVNDDNAIYNAVRNPNTSLATVVDDWIESYQTETGPAMAELVNFILRCCGCNATVDEHQAEDDNGIVDVLDGVQDDMKQAAQQAYPLVSRSKQLKKFRSSLATFLTTLFTSTAVSATLYDENFCQLFQSWIVSLSSSKIRSFRHTSTVFALMSTSGLCEVAVGVNKEFAQASRAKEAEEKKGRKDKARLKDLEKTVAEVHKRKEALEVFLTDIFDSVFVNRYRDSDAVIRSECIKALGQWMKIHPNHFLEGTYLRYIGWVLSDEHKDVRYEAVKALIALYAKEDHVAAMQHFTDRFKDNLVKMACGEIELSVRISCIHVLRQIHKHGLLEEDQIDKVAMLVFEEEKRVRTAVAGFFEGVLEEAVEEKEGLVDASSGRGKEVKAQLGMKVLAELLVKYGRALDGVDPVEGEEEEEDESEGKLDVVEQVATHRGRVAFAVDAIWDSVPAVKEWEKLTDFLLLDHSSTGETPKKGKGKGKKQKDDELDDACRLTEDEETVLVEVFVASLTKITGGGQGSKKEKEKDDDSLADITRSVIEALPRLFAKHQSIPTRIVDILTIPTLISLDMYLDLRKVTAYESLWDDVQKQFTNHTDARVIDQAVKTISALVAASALGNTNKTKLAALEESLVSALRDAVAGKDIESSAFEEDELLALDSSVARIHKLYNSHDLTASLDDIENDEAGNWDLIDSLAERGRLGYKDEASMVAHALSILNNQLLWRVRALTQSDDEVDLAELASVVARRDAILERLEEYAIGSNANAVDSVKQLSLTLLLTIYLLCNTVTLAHSDPDGQFADLKLECSDQLQSRCAGFIEAEIGRYAETLAENVEDAEDEEEEDDEIEVDSDDDGAAARKKKKQKQKTKAKAAPKKAPVTAASIRADNARKQAQLVAAGQFDRTIAAFAGAIHQNVISIEHAAVVLIHFERFTPTYDVWCKLLVQDLRDEGIYGDNGAVASKNVVTSLTGACDLLLDGTDTSEERLVALSRLLAGAVVVRGAQLAIVNRLHTTEHLQIHVDSLSFIVKKLETFEEANKKDSRNNALLFFKALANLLIGVDGKGALKIKTSLDSLIEKSNLEIPVTAKAWEPLRAYQKRLVTLMAKDPTIKKAAEKVKKAASVGSDAVTDDEAIEEDSPPARASAAKALPKARRVSARKSKTPDDDEDDDEDDEVLPARASTRSKRGAPPPNDDDDDDSADEAPATPKKRKIAAVRKEVELEPDLSDDADEVEGRLVSSSQTRSKGKKRAISPEPDVDEDEQTEQEEDEEERLVGSSRPLISTASQVSLSEVKRVKKKARR